MIPSIALAERHEAVRKAASRFRADNPRVFGSVPHGADSEAVTSIYSSTALPGATLFDLGGLQLELERLLGVPVDVVTLGDLPLKIRELVFTEARPI